MGQSEDRGNKLERITNIAILAVSAVILLSHSGAVVHWVKQRSVERTERRLVAQTWEELLDAASVLNGVGVARDRPIVVEFMDYQCPACGAVGPSVTDASDRGAVGVVIRHLPLEAIHPMARTAAKAAVCAERQGLFKPAHELLLSDDAWVTSDDWDWVAFAEVVGVGDLDEFARCLAGAEAEARIDRDKNLATALSVVSTPTFVTAGGIHRGVGGFRAAVEGFGGHSNR